MAKFVTVMGLTVAALLAVVAGSSLAMHILSVAMAGP